MLLILVIKFIFLYTLSMNRHKGIDLDEVI